MRRGAIKRVVALDQDAESLAVVAGLERHGRSKIRRRQLHPLKDRGENRQRQANAAENKNALDRVVTPGSARNRRLRRIRDGSNRMRYVQWISCRHYFHHSASCSFNVASRPLPAAIKAQSLPRSVLRLKDADSFFGARLRKLDSNCGSKRLHENRPPAHRIAWIAAVLRYCRHVAGWHHHNNAQQRDFRTCRRASSYPA